MCCPKGFPGESGEGRATKRDAGFETCPEQGKNQNRSSDFAELSWVRLNIDLHDFIMLISLLAQKSTQHPEHTGSQAQTPRDHLQQDQEDVSKPGVMLGTKRATDDMCVRNGNTY